MDKIGVVHGRFQGLHKGHMEFLLAGKKRCEHLVIGITNYLGNAKDNTISQIDAHRLTDNANPFTYFERMEMLRGSMLEYGISESDFSIVPFPVEDIHILFNFVPKEAAFYLTIYDDWGREKLRRLRSLGIEVTVLWERSEAEKPVSGTLVRNAILNGNDWRDFVPQFVFDYINRHKLDKRIKQNGK